jgi:hypothetical protein
VNADRERRWKQVLQLVAEDTPPVALRDAYVVAMVLALGLEPTKLGEAFNTTAYMLARVLAHFGHDTEPYGEDITALYEKLRRLLADNVDEITRRATEDVQEGADGD